MLGANYAALRIIMILLHGTYPVKNEDNLAGSMSRRVDRVSSSRFLTLLCVLCSSILRLTLFVAVLYSVLRVKV